MRMRFPAILISLMLVFAVFLAMPLGVFAEEKENHAIWGKIEVIPKDSNALGDIITVRIKVFWVKSEVDFDHRQIPQVIRFPYFEIRGAKYSSERSKQYAVDIWEFKVQYFMSVPPLVRQIPAIRLQYQRRGPNYLSSFEIPGVSVPFVALSQPGSLPEPIIREIAFSDKKRITALYFLGVGLLLILGGIALAIVFLRKELAGRRKIVLRPQEFDNFLMGYESLWESFQEGENTFLVLHRLYLLLRSFFRKKRGIKLSMNWQEHLAGEEKALTEELRGFYGKDYKKDLVSRAHAKSLLERAEKILKGG